jgi:hypothetical protein
MMSLSSPAIDRQGTRGHGGVDGGRPAGRALSAASGGLKEQNVYTRADHVYDLFLVATDESIIALLQAQFGSRPFRMSEAVEAGISRTVLYRIRAAGVLEPAGRGILRLAGTAMGVWSDFAVVCARAPGGTICLNSALGYWDLTDEIPALVHLAVPRGARRPAIGQPITKVHVFGAATFELERQHALTDADEPFWIYSAERSVVDAMRTARWVGRDVGLHALRRYLARPGASPARVSELAAELGGSARVRSALEAHLS